MSFFNRHKKKGVLFDKTPEQKQQFFLYMENLSQTDYNSFKSQYLNMNPEEQSEFGQFVIDRTKNHIMILKLLGIIKNILNKKK